MPTHQYSFPLITRHIAESSIDQRAEDGYINATQLCRVAGKRWHNYLREEKTGQFLRKLAEQQKVRLEELYPDLRSAAGMPDTWVHPQVAIHLGQWLSADFAVKVSSWVVDWMSGKGAPTHAPAVMPYHIERHMLNVGKVPHTHFSILQEMTTTLIAPLEMQGYRLPERMVPDISQGKMFCKIARDKHGVDTDALPTYPHEYPDGRVVDAKLYPIELLPAFRRYIAEVWMPERAMSYFRDRDPLALPSLDKLLRIEYKPQPRKTGLRRSGGYQSRPSA